MDPLRKEYNRWNVRGDGSYREVRGWKLRVKLIAWSMSFLVVSILMFGQEHHGPQRPSRSPQHSLVCKVIPYFVDRDDRQGDCGKERFLKSQINAFDLPSMRTRRS